MTRELRSIAAVALAVSRAVEASAIYDAALDALGEALGAERAAVLLRDPDGVVRFKAWRGLSDGYRQAVTGHFPWPADAPDPQPILVPDVEREPSLKGFRDLFRAERIGALGFVPLASRGRLLGKLMVYYARPHDFAEAELLVASTIAHHVAFALERALADAERASLLARERAARAEAEAALAARDAFLARASHELRTPLTSAIGTVRLLKRAASGTLKEPPETLIDIASRNLSVMFALINNLLDASKLAAGSEPLALETLPAATLVAESVEVIGAQAREKGVRLETAIPADLRITADPVKLEQVLVNLLANAVKFTPPGGLVAVEAEARGPEVLLRVRDTGEGLPAEELERIFEPFFQADRPGRRRQRGTGLGLAICRQIVTLHGGSIRAESEGPGRGSTFVVRFPGPRAEGRAA